MSFLFFANFTSCLRSDEFRKSLSELNSIRPANRFDGKAIRVFLPK